MTSKEIIAEHYKNLGHNKAIMFIFSPNEKGSEFSSKIQNSLDKFSSKNSDVKGGLTQAALTYDDLFLSQIITFNADHNHTVDAMAFISENINKDNYYIGDINPSGEIDYTQKNSSIKKEIEEISKLIFENKEYFLDGTSRLQENIQERINDNPLFKNYSISEVLDKYKIASDSTKERLNFLKSEMESLVYDFSSMKQIKERIKTFEKIYQNTLVEENFSKTTPQENKLEEAMPVYLNKNNSINSSTMENQEVKQDKTANNNTINSKDISIHQIEVRMGSRWIPIEYYQDFGKFLFNDKSFELIYQKTVDSYEVTNQSFTLAAGNFGTDKRNANKIIIDALNIAPPKVEYTDPITGQTLLDNKATKEAMQKYDDMSESFSSWIYQSEDRRNKLEEIYNKKFNTTVKPSYDGSILQIPDINGITLTPHQKDAIDYIKRSQGISNIKGENMQDAVLNKLEEAMPVSLNNNSINSNTMVSLPDNVKTVINNATNMEGLITNLYAIGYTASLDENNNIQVQEVPKHLNPDDGRNSYGQDLTPDIQISLIEDACQDAYGDYLQHAEIKVLEDNIKELEPYTLKNILKNQGKIDKVETISTNINIESNKFKNKNTMENQEVKQDKTANDFFKDYRSNPTTSFINHRDIFSLLMAVMPKEDKLKALNDFVKPEQPFTELKGWNKSKVIDEIVKPIINNKNEGEIMGFKADINAMKDAAIEKFKKFEKTEKGDIKFIEPKVSPKEYLEFLINNRDSIVNAEKNKDEVSSAMLMLAYHENKNAAKFSKLLEASGVSPERAKEFVNSDVFNHTEETNKIKKLVARDINSDVQNTEAFKKATKMTPSVKKEQDNSLDQRTGRGIRK